jgi:hypothetical protein
LDAECGGGEGGLLVDGNDDAAKSFRDEKVGESF